jgi:nucleotide-binding universal stress UspA family protein
MTTASRPVLVGIDGTPSGLEALALGSAFAVLTGAPLLLGAAYGFSGGSFAGGLIWPPAGDADRWLEEATEQLGDAVPWSTRTIQATSPAAGLLQLAKLEDASMIVLGSNRDGPIGRVLAGSTARRVAHGAPCAVAVAPHDWRLQPADADLVFGVGVSATPESREALKLAAEFAAAAHAPLKLFTAVHIPPPAHPMFAATSVGYGQWKRERIAFAERMAAEAIEAVEPEVTPEVVVMQGEPVERLADESRKLDILVVGSRGYGPLRSVLLGGVSGPLIERAACPIVIVPRGGHPEPELRVDDELIGVGS